jgi:uncharacterized protein (DUF427 family)
LPNHNFHSHYQPDDLAPFYRQEIIVDLEKPKKEPTKESVRDYPRPPRVEKCEKRIQVVFNDLVIADTTHANRVLETNHPPVYYIPPGDLQIEYLHLSDKKSFCEWKGIASYYTIIVRERLAKDAAWYYPDPTPAFLAIKHYVAFYPQLMDACYVDGELVQPQPGVFYGGWITKDIIGPFKGKLGSENW